jgi:predicted DNA-binding protein
MLSIRLPASIEQKLKFVSKIKKLSKSALVKKALVDFFINEEQSSYDAGKEFFGRYGSKNGNFSVAYKKSIKEKLNAKRRSY